MKPISREVVEATNRARVFLLPPEANMRERADTLQSGAVLVRQVVELAVRGGRDDLALRALTLAQDLER